MVGGGGGGRQHDFALGGMIGGGGGGKQHFAAAFTGLPVRI
jgi:hypothetical protein